MGEQVRDQQGTVYRLEEELGAGGQGKVFAVADNARLAVKRFHDEILSDKDCARLRLKVAALRQKQLDRKLPAAAWPQFSVFTGGG
jgi:hypothetical protein